MGKEKRDGVVLVSLVDLICFCEALVGFALCCTERYCVRVEVAFGWIEG